MPKNVLTPYKLKPKQRRILANYLAHRGGRDETAAALGISTQRLYTMTNAIIRHACRTKRIDIDAVLKDY